MQADSVVDADPIARAVAAAEQVFDPRPGVTPYEPGDEHEARAAVQRLGELFSELPASIAEALDGARRSGTLVSSDRLQGLAEVVQNADDAEASEVRLLVTPAALLVSHNGNPVRLPDVLGLATPWLSTKTGDARAIGRFGIGLAALRSLSTTLEVHCAPYHLEIDDSTLGPAGLPELPEPFREPGWTTLRIPVAPGTVQPADVEAWLNRWDDSALLFLRHVALVSLLDEGGTAVCRLALSRGPAEEVVSDVAPVEVRWRLARADDGRSWAAYSAEMPAPSGVSRAHKATATTTPVAVALPLQAPGAGQIHAGLPVARTRSPLFANAQFDPLTSRADFADTRWNQALVGLVADVWSEAVLDLFARDPRAAWQVVPVPAEGEAGSDLIEALEAAAVVRARRVVASRLSFAVPGGARTPLSELAVEAEPLEGILEEDEIAGLAGLGATLPVAARDPGGRWREVLDDWRSHGADLPEPVGVERGARARGRRTAATGLDHRAGRRGPRGGSRRDPAHAAVRDRPRRTAAGSPGSHISGRALGGDHAPRGGDRPDDASPSGSPGFRGRRPRGAGVAERVRSAPRRFRRRRRHPTPRRGRAFGPLAGLDALGQPTEDAPRRLRAHR